MKDTKRNPEKGEMKKKYVAIDLKSFYASVECVERKLDPLDTCLVVADGERTEKTICLAVSPALKAYGIGGRARLFEVIQRVNEINSRRGRQGSSYSKKTLDAHPEIEVRFLVAPPRMAYYIEYSTRIYDIYLKYIAPEDIHVYSIDEVIMDVTSYLAIYKMNAHELAVCMIRDVLSKTGVTATAGIGTNMYLCKVAMDIVAKKMPPDVDGVRIAEIDEMSYRRQLWEHTPLTDFWRVGRGIASRLAPYGIQTMGDIARCSLKNEDLLYRLFGVNAELLIDHAWGWEPVTMNLVKSYRPDTSSMCNGQVLHKPYTADRARVVVIEMADSISLDLIDKRLLTDQIVLTIGYDAESLNDSSIMSRYHGRISTDFYGRKVPVHAHGTVNFKTPVSSAKIIIKNVAELYDRIINPILLVRRITISVNRLISEDDFKSKQMTVQLNLFDDPDEIRQRQKAEKAELQKERRQFEAVLTIKKMFGKNAILKGLNFDDGATQRDRNRQIGGHHE